MPHHEDVRLTSPARRGCHRQVDRVCSRIKGGHVPLHADAGRLVRVVVDERLAAENLAGPLDRLMHRTRHARSRRILEADRVERNVRSENAPQRLLIKVRIVSPRASGRQLHQRHTNLMLQPVLDDALPRVDEVVDIVQRVEVANGGHAMFFEQLGMQIDNVRRLRLQPDDVHASRERLQIRLRPGGLPELVHHVEGVFVAIEVQRLIPRPAPRLEVRDARIPRRLDRWDEVLGEHTCPVDRLKAVPEGRTHEGDFFGHWWVPFNAEARSSRGGPRRGYWFVGHCAAKDAVFQDRDIEVDEESDGAAAEAEVREQLGFVNRINGFNRLHFDNHLLCNQEVETIAGLQPQALVLDGQSHFRLKFNLLSSQLSR